VFMTMTLFGSSCPHLLRASTSFGLLGIDACGIDVDGRNKSGHDICVELLP